MPVTPYIFPKLIVTIAPPLTFPRIADVRP